MLLSGCAGALNQAVLFQLICTCFTLHTCHACQAAGGYGAQLDAVHGSCRICCSKTESCTAPYIDASLSLLAVVIKGYIRNVLYTC